jgi:hypothetical protein
MPVVRDEAPPTYTTYIHLSQWPCSDLALFPSNKACIYAVTYGEFSAADFVIMHGNRIFKYMRACQVKAAAAKAACSIRKRYPKMRLYMGNKRMQTALQSATPRGHSAVTGTAPHPWLVQVRAAAANGTFSIRNQTPKLHLHVGQRVLQTALKCASPRGHAKALGAVLPIGLSSEGRCCQTRLFNSEKVPKDAVIYGQYQDANCVAVRDTPRTFSCHRCSSPMACPGQGRCC